MTSETLAGPNDRAPKTEAFPNIALRIRNERRARRMRLKDLAQASGCSESLLSRVENGLVMPSLTTLHRLCQGLQISVTALLSAEDGNSCVIYKAGERPRYSSGGWVEGDGSMAESLVPFIEGRLLEAHIMHVPPNGTWCGPYHHAGEEVGYILDGELELQVSGKNYHLSTGDSFFFTSDREHLYRAAGETACRILWVNTPPTF